MFSSNVQPKVIKHPEKTPWYCFTCDQDVSPWHKKCPNCLKPRKD